MHGNGQDAYPPGFGDFAADEFPLGNPFSLDANIRGGPSDPGTSGLQTAHVQVRVTKMSLPVPAADLSPMLSSTL